MYYSDKKYAELVVATNKLLDANSKFTKHSNDAKAQQRELGVSKSIGVFKFVNRQINDIDKMSKIMYSLYKTVINRQNKSKKPIKALLAIIHTLHKKISKLRRTSLDESSDVMDLKVRLRLGFEVSRKQMDAEHKKKIDALYR